MESAKALLQNSRVEALEQEILSSYREREAGIVRNIDTLLSTDTRKRVSTSDEAKVAFLEDLRRRNEELEEQASKRRKDIESKRRILEEYKGLVRVKKSMLESLEAAQVLEKQKYELKLESLEDSIIKEKEIIESLEGNMKGLWAKRRLLQSELKERLVEERALGEKQRKLLEEKESIQQETLQCDRQLTELQSQIAALQKRIQDANNRALAKFEPRRERRNLLQELKGNIRVYCRIRPVLETVDKAELVVHLVSNKTVEVRTPVASLTGGSGGISSKGIRTEAFSLDHVFGCEAGQGEVFAEVSSFVRSALDGYNVCIFAYGQTGSGKTHTMTGDLAAPSSFGIIPRSVDQIFKATQDLGKLGWRFELEVSFQEIYNEKLIDLLCKDNKISQNTGLHAYQPTQKPVSSPEELFELVKFAADNRTTAQTQYNMYSSRSHSVFQIRIRGRNEETKQANESVLNLIDLAGSESMDTLNKGKEREQETKSINKSLSALKDVITALAEHKDHIPTRNSKLTYLLKDSLGGNCKTLMFVMVSPLLKNAHQSVQSLRFASKVNSCYVGVAKKN